MRRRWTVGAIPYQMDKGNSKNQISKLCILSFLCVVFWSSLLYFHFIVLGSTGVNESNSLESNLIRIETFNPVPVEPIKVPVFDVDVKSTSNGMENNSSNDGEKLALNNDLEVSHNGGESEVNNEVEPEIVSVGNRKIDLGSKSSDPNREKNEPPEFDVGSKSSDPNPKNNEPQEIDVESTSSDPNPKKIEPQEIDVWSKSNSDPNPKKDEPQEIDLGLKISYPNPKDRVPLKDDPQELEFPFIRALRTAENTADPCGGRYIYVHDLPSRFNEDMLKECRSLSVWTDMCKFTTNAGLGPPLENIEGVFSNTGWYATNQFAVDVIFNNRMKQYECLTNDSSIAAAVFVPFYAGFDIARYLWGYNISTRDAASLDLVDWLINRPEWKIMNGRDHFLVAGRITWDFRRLSEDEHNWGSKLLFLPAAKNMSMLVVESSPWNANDFAIPYPTYFHPAKDADVFVWQDRMRNLQREYLFSFAGAPRPGNPESIRSQIIDQCNNTKACKLLECDFGESKCHSPSSIMKMFQSSLFCLQPQGDSYTRRSAFDSMLAGCIPVFFHPGSAFVQYTWHLPKNFSSYSVFISENDVRKKNISIEDRLREIPPEQVEIMRDTVINLIPKLVYADPRSKLETLPDAFDLSVQAVINKVTRLRKNIIQGRTEYDNFIEETSWKYALLDEGQREVGAHEWDPFFSKAKEGEGDSNGASAEAAKNSWKNEQKSQTKL